MSWGTAGANMDDANVLFEPGRISEGPDVNLERSETYVMKAIEAITATMDIFLPSLQFCGFARSSGPSQPTTSLFSLRASRLGAWRSGASKLSLGVGSMSVRGAVVLNGDVLLGISDRCHFVSLERPSSLNFARSAAWQGLLLTLCAWKDSEMLVCSGRLRTK